MEFVPFNDQILRCRWKMLKELDIMIHEVEEGKDYALLMSTNTAGAWQYLIGNTMHFL